MARKKRSWNPTYGKWTSEAMEKTLQAVQKKQLSLRKAAKQYNVPQATLCQRLKKGVSASSPASRPPTFTTADEKLLVPCIQDMESLGFGLNISSVCKLAYEVAEAENIPHQFNKEKKTTGYDWYEGFMNRNPELSFRSQKVFPLLVPQC